MLGTEDHAFVAASDMNGRAYYQIVGHRDRSDQPYTVWRQDQGEKRIVRFTESFDAALVFLASH